MVLLLLIGDASNYNKQKNLYTKFICYLLGCCRRRDDGAADDGDDDIWGQWRKMWLLCFSALFWSIQAMRFPSKNVFLLVLLLLLVCNYCVCVLFCLRLTPPHFRLQLVRNIQIHRYNAVKENVQRRGEYYKYHSLSE